MGYDVLFYPNPTLPELEIAARYVTSVRRFVLGRSDGQFNYCTLENL